VAVDFSFPVEMTRLICSKAKYFIVLDHHASAERNLVGLPGTPGFENFDYIFDMDRSGAQIAWDWVHREGGKPNPVPVENKSRYPWFIDVIAARDLWRWDIYPHSKSLGKAMHLLGYYSWEKMFELVEEMTLPKGPTKTIEYLRSIGDPMIESEKRAISKAVGHSILVEFEGYRVRLGHCESHIRSEVGNGLCNKNDCLFSATWRYDFETDQWWISLRGNDASIDVVDLSVLVSRYGGGGHPKACGFAIHGQRSAAFNNADTEKRRTMAHGNLHDYFKLIVKE
jgi:oligoribonuclease NrnB/cAMP/cGMP phosphodiesterase (DHH superfamily)